VLLSPPKTMAMLMVVLLNLPMTIWKSLG